MQFGIFDHVDRADRPLNTQLAERLAYVAAADAAGFYAYHVAEHHATPLNMVPVPGVYLGAVAPFELNFHKVNADQSRAIFLDAFAVLRRGLTHERLSHVGPHFTYDNVP